MKRLTDRARYLRERREHRITRGVIREQIACMDSQRERIVTLEAMLARAGVMIVTWERPVPVVMPMPCMARGCAS